MPYTVVFTSSAKKEFEKLAKDLQVRISIAVSGLVHDARPNSCKKLKGIKNAYCIRAGVYRVIYEIEDSILRISVLGASHRKDICE